MEYNYDRLKYEAVLADGETYRIFNDAIYSDVRSLTKYRLYFYVTTTCEAKDEDWKTATAQHIKPIPRDTEIRVNNLLVNFYGQYIETTYNGVHYYIDPKNVKYSRCEKIDF